jgi:hypothetical protein
MLASFAVFYDLGIDQTPAAFVEKVKEVKVSTPNLLTVQRQFIRRGAYHLHLAFYF